MEKNVDFSVCEFIDENMWFFTYNDFCDHAKLIKNLFQKLERNGKKFYMWYVYSNIHMSETYKNAIWDYLNQEPAEYYIRLIELKRTYHAK